VGVSVRLKYDEIIVLLLIKLIFMLELKLKHLRWIDRGGCGAGAREVRA
jgi:hypothetical protein